MIIRKLFLISIDTIIFFCYWRVYPYSIFLGVNYHDSSNLFWNGQQRDWEREIDWERAIMQERRGRAHKALTSFGWIYNSEYMLFIAYSFIGWKF